MSKKHKHFHTKNVAPHAVKTYAHKCIKCKADYQSKEDDPYLCDDCNATRLAVAKEIDAKIKTTGQVPNSDLTTYMNAVRANGGKFPSLAQMGIKW